MQPFSYEAVKELEKRFDFWNRTDQLATVAAAANRENVNPWALLSFF